jgi:hypothetical protein
MNLGFTSIELITGLLACLAAVGMGTLLAKRQARAFSPQARINKDKLRSLPRVNHIDYGEMRFLHLGTPWVQGSMKISRPNEIHLEYVQRMMAWLLVADLDQVHRLQAMQLGLGAAALTKFCHLRLGMPTTAVELNPQVIDTCRRWFKLPQDSAELHVLQADAADIASRNTWHGKVDVLQVDLYDQEAACPVIDSEAFYADCQKLLTAQGNKNRAFNGNVNKVPNKPMAPADSNAAPKSSNSTPSGKLATTSSTIARIGHCSSQAKPVIY